MFLHKTHELNGCFTSRLLIYYSQLMFIYDKSNSTVELNIIKCEYTDVFIMLTYFIYRLSPIQVWCLDFYVDCTWSVVLERFKVRSGQLWYCCFLRIASQRYYIYIYILYVSTHTFNCLPSFGIFRFFTGFVSYVSSFK